MTPDHSPPPAPLIFQALANVMADVRAVGKTEQNAAQGFAFRGIDGVMNAVGPALRAHQVIAIPTCETVDTSSVEVGSRRTPMGHVLLRVRYTFYAVDGSSVDAVVPAESFDAGDKAVTKAMSVAMRTALIQTLALPTNEPDPDSVSYERATPPPRPDGDVFDRLREETRRLADPDPVVAWLKEEHVTRGTLTDDLVDKWRTRIREAARDSFGEEPSDAE